MKHPITLGAIALAALLAIGHANAFDQTKYPDLSGQWHRVGAPAWDATATDPPLTAEYRAIYEARKKDGNDPTLTCLPPGMPRAMNVYAPMEIVVTPGTTHILIEHVHDSRRIYTDGRPWPEEIETSFRGQSIGQWEDTDGDGRYDTLVVETRHLKGPRAFDGTGLPLHADSQTVIKERIYLDKRDPNLLVDEVTVTDNALTRPWTVTKTYRRDGNRSPVWLESICAEKSKHVGIGSEIYAVGPDGLLMPNRKDQPPPDLRYFPQARR
jgi:hypothetical protein